MWPRPARFAMSPTIGPNIAAASPPVRHRLAVCGHQSPHGWAPTPSPLAGEQPTPQFWKSTESVLLSLAMALAQRSIVGCDKIR
jgi:hypothetical protein